MKVGLNLLFGDPPQVKNSQRNYSFTFDFGLTAQPLLR